MTREAENIFAKAYFYAMKFRHLYNIEHNRSEGEMV
jgi:hypothetical protein